MFAITCFFELPLVKTRIVDDGPVAPVALPLPENVSLVGEITSR